MQREYFSAKMLLCHQLEVRIKTGNKQQALLSLAFCRFIVGYVCQTCFHLFPSFMLISNRSRRPFVLNLPSTLHYIWYLYSFLTLGGFISNEKEETPWCGVLLESLRASEAAQLPADEQIRLEGGLRGRWSLHYYDYYTVHPVCACLCLTPALVSHRIVRFPWQMGEEKVRRVFRDALKIWSDVTPLTFTEVHSGKADIRIDFTRLEHREAEKYMWNILYCKECVNNTKVK